MFNLPAETPAAEKKERASRGKKAEADVRKWLDRLNNAIANFDFERVYDARSARGKATARTGDFNVWCGPGYTIEVKEVDHAFRLPAKNFNQNAVARMVKRQLAGARALVLVYHKPTNLWRMLGITPFQERSTSWDLSIWPTYSADAMFKRLQNMFLSEASSAG